MNVPISDGLVRFFVWTRIFRNRVNFLFNTILFILLTRPRQYSAQMEIYIFGYTFLYFAMKRALTTLQLDDRALQEDVILRNALTHQDSNERAQKKRKDNVDKFSARWKANLSEWDQLGLRTVTHKVLDLPRPLRPGSYLLSPVFSSEIFQIIISYRCNTRSCYDRTQPDASRLLRRTFGFDLVDRYRSRCELLPFEPSVDRNIFQSCSQQSDNCC
jgi:hypothetical protein